MSRYGESIWQTRSTLKNRAGIRKKLNFRPPSVWRRALERHQKDCINLRAGKACPGCVEMRERLHEAETL